MSFKEDYTKMSMAIPRDLKVSLEEAASHEGVSMTRILLDSFRMRSKLGMTSGEGERNLEVAILSKFAIPESIHYRSFWVFLFLLSERYPEESSSDFWGSSVYMSARDMTHSEVVDDIRKEIENRNKIEKTH